MQVTQKTALMLLIIVILVLYISVFINILN